MQRISLRSFSLALVALSASAAFAATPAEPLTRAQVRAELQQAQRTGHVLAPGESGLTRNQLFPSQYPQQTSGAENTRAQVKADLQQARRSGDLLAPGESGLQLNALYPQRYNGVH
ncbi:DUF4148 domain-containing protein [Simplicispira psychrophila]|uniref:DUF4148 domain-containing protein n=1 Tax=Simplicispira psychrophila TaxID=80882 RepID=UPI000691C7D5|nr:DUF4148 domain-containing protein [Simplicispira psychrophila]